MASTPRTIDLPRSFPQSDYTPFGYIDNPYHSSVYNRSGVIRTVPPMGFGWWARSMPWPYGLDVERAVSSLSFLHLSVNVGAAAGATGARSSDKAGHVTFHTADDFKARGVALVSRYHTKTMMSYDWSFDGVNVSGKYFLADENALICVLEVEQASAAAGSRGSSPPGARRITVHATNIYGYPGHMYWGCDGVTSSFRRGDNVGVSKIWAYGDVMVIGANRKGGVYKATLSVEEWNRWIYANDLTANEGALARFHETSDPLYTVMSYTLDLPAGAVESLVICLARGVNEAYALRQYFKSIRGAHREAARQLADDEHFYAHAPLLVGDWPERWKHGWIYDLETLRMTIRRPTGIYKHPWDAMQIHTPRAVLGETCLDALCLSYADVELAKEVLYGVFADAPAPNVPCTREDGSVNMIGESGAECGTAPTWGFPFVVIQSIYERTRDDAWIRRLYPYLKAFIEWWLVHRTDDEGWFHAENSWESGQDGSRRFLHSGAQEGTPAHFVRTVDIEAGMAHAMLTMVDFARIAGYTQDVEMWQRLAEDRIARTRSMYVEEWFRDWDGRENRPFLLEGYYDVMMLVPLSVRVATPEQVEGVKPRFAIFRDNPTPFLEWPSFWLPFSEAGWNAGLRAFIAEELVKVGHRIYERTDAREISPASSRYQGRLPAPYNYRIPGVASEFWPVKLDGHPILNGCEHYGWGATFPTLAIRNLIGFREMSNRPQPDAASGAVEASASPAQPSAETQGFILAPALPASMFETGKTYGITNLQCCDCCVDVHYTVKAGGRLAVRLVWALDAGGVVMVRDQAGGIVAQSGEPVARGALTFEAVNGALYSVTWRTIQ
mgnify:CR=1 FL=1